MESGALAVPFRLENGASLSFVLGADQIPHTRQTLEVMEGSRSRQRRRIRDRTEVFVL